MPVAIEAAVERQEAEQADIRFPDQAETVLRSPKPAH
jgi:hypothetical protein